MQNAATRSHRYSYLTIAQLVVSLSSALSSLAAAAFLAFFASNNFSTAPAVKVSFSTGPLVLWTLGALTLIGAWSAFVAIRKLGGHQPQDTEDKLLRASLILIPIWAAIAAGAANLSSRQFSPGLMAPLTVMLVIIPLIVLVALGIEKIQHGTVQHFWGLVSGSIFVTMPLTMLIEGIFLLIGVLSISVNVASNPDLLFFFLNLSQLETVTQAQLEQIYTQLTPLFSSPAVAYGVIFGFCVLAPLVEELFKPLMIWVFARRKLTPAQGFGMGLICGAAFALIESVLAMQAATSANFLQIILGRTGTSTLHIFCTGMMGWAIVSGWQDGNALRTFLVYTGVVVTHGLWNFFALLLGSSALPLSLPVTVESLASASPWILALLFVWMITILWVMKTRILAQVPPPLAQLPVDNLNENRA